ncbi:MAG: VWA domain-containing protein [Deltaproteobacteria bacterium]|nr:VWA domain-containing protein [Deltaproteobacteria bacterium]
MKSARYFFIVVFLGCSAETTDSETVSVLRNVDSGDIDNGGKGGVYVTTVPTGGSGENKEVQTPQTELVPVQTPENDAGQCGSVTVEAVVEIITQPGNLLVIFDRSMSMSNDWNGQPRYQAAGQALIDAVTPMQDLLTVGGVFFPSPPSATGDAGTPTCNVVDPFAWIPPDGACLNAFTDPNAMLAAIGASCEVTEITADDQLTFRSGAEFVSELPNRWLLQGDGPGMTPLETAVTQADSALASTPLTGPVAVVIMTDGEPNCGTNPDNVNNIIAKWATNGIKTYVVGLPGSTEASDVLNRLAVTGGTDAFIEPSDPAALQARFSTIAGETVKSGFKSCEISLQKTEEADLDKLHLVVTENGQEKDAPRDLNNGAGWRVNADGTVATMFGGLCDDAKNGRFTSVRFYFGCTDLPPLIIE